ncbi:Synaptojanin-2-binding protein [Aphelenchoides bicaudatus]|nr:Synaptojanin-2-binding protein [Aphelenchoides bicaudatus]
MSTGNNHARTPSRDFDQFPEPSILSIEITIKRNETGLGFNIVGGIDCPHIPGHRGIFVSKIRPDSAAALDGRLSVGDRILTCNGVYLSDKTHEEAVEVFRDVETECKMNVEPDAERILLSQPSNLIMPSSNSPTQMRTACGSTATTPRRGSPPRNAQEDFKSLSQTDTIKPSALTESLNKLVMEQARTEPSPNGSLNTLPPLQNDKLSDGKKPKLQKAVPVIAKVQPTPTPPASPTRHLQNLKNSRAIDDIPPTPKKPVGLLDPRSHSIYTDIAFLSIGALAIGLGIYVGYRYFRRRN